MKRAALALESDSAGVDGKKGRMEDVFELWEDFLLSGVFGVSLSRTGARVKESIHLEGLEAELREEGGPHDLSQLVDRVLVARLTLHPPPTGAVPYLMRCYDRASKDAATPVKARGGRERAEEVAERARGILAACKAAAVTYFALSATNPGMWGQRLERDGMDAFVDALRDPAASSVAAGFLDDLIAHLKENDELGSFCAGFLDAVAAEVSAVEQAAEKAGQAGGGDGLASAMPLLGVMSALTVMCGKKELCREFAASPHFSVPDGMTGSSIFGATLFSRLCRFRGTHASYRARDGQNVVTLYSQVPPRTEPSVALRIQISEVMQEQRRTYASLHSSLEMMAKAMLKEPLLRDSLLGWIGRACDLNLAKLKTGVQQGMTRADVSDDVEMLNLLCLLLNVCAPFTDLDTPRGRGLAAKVDLSFLLSGRRFSVEKDDRLAVTGENLDRWLDSRNLARIQQFQARESAAAEAKAADAPAEAQAAGAPAAGAGAAGGARAFGTVSEFTGLASRLCHLAVTPAIAKYKQLDRYIDHLRRERAEAQRLIDAGASPMQAMGLTVRLGRVTAELEKQVLWRLQMMTVLFDPNLVQQLLGFLRLQAHCLLDLAHRESGAEGDAIAELPLQPPREGSVFAGIPDHAVDDIAEVFCFMSMALAPSRERRNQVDELSAGAKRTMLSFLTAFVDSPHHVRNPYLRAKLVEALLAFVPVDEERSGGFAELHSLFAAHDLASRFLAPMLLRFFVEIEFTGSHTQFYDKFRFRSVAAKILAFLWTLPRYRETVVATAGDAEFFIGFVNMIINDTIYNMDEALSKITEMRETQRNLADAAYDWGPPDEGQRQAAEELQDQRSGAARHYLKEAMQLVHMMGYLTAEEAVRAPFMANDMRTRVAEMLNYFMTYLTGPKANNLNIDNKDDLDFKPLEVLINLVTIYVNFSSREGFAASVAGDQRSYSPQYFVKAINLLRKHGGIAQSTLEAFKDFAAAVEAESERLAAEEQDLGDIPDEFLDPLTYDIMKDPVRLPTSDMIMDRASIKRHLLSDHTDPFNRQHLTMDMLEPAEDIARRIAEWVASRRGAAQ